MGRLKRCAARPDNARPRPLARSGRAGHSMTPMKAFSRGSVRRKGRFSRRLSPVRESVSATEGEGGLSAQPKDELHDAEHKEITVSCNADTGSDDDSTSVTMPTGVSTFLLDCMDSDTSSSVLSSPEVFRKRDSYALEEMAQCFSDDDLKDLPLKNSTLLDVSSAQDIITQQPPNLSSILEASGKIDAVPGNMLVPLTVNTMCLRHALSGTEEGVSNEKTPQTGGIILPPPVRKSKPQTVRIQPIKCRKKVTFTEPDGLRPCTQSSGNGRDRKHPERSSPSSDAHHKAVHASGSASENPEEHVKFFDFANEKERNVFFHKLRHTYPLIFPSRFVDPS
ncbi:uncharacterized protein LOC114793032 isoform X2 [Denticeps clupeoides]|uniref:uncharacterized protein LOC114793032 isoform X2 n=1 Tax=Denticeps clupeoides TaxID=299321 RepID=UPI0010A2CA74|nr:uncharacterized protein LOC114793032 isoform X2 [Denticeps clupeoides]